MSKILYNKFGKFFTCKCCGNILIYDKALCIENIDILCCRCSYYIENFEYMKSNYEIDLYIYHKTEINGMFNELINTRNIISDIRSYILNKEREAKRLDEIYNNLKILFDK